MFRQFWRNLYQRHGDITVKADCLQVIACTLIFSFLPCTCTCYLYLCLP